MKMKNVIIAFSVLTLCGSAADLLPAAVSHSIENGAFRLTVTESETGVDALLYDKRAESAWNDGAYMYSITCGTPEGAASFTKLMEKNSHAGGRGDTHRRQTGKRLYFANFYSCSQQRFS